MGKDEWYQPSIEDDFVRARTKEFFEKIGNFLLRKEDGLLSLDEVKNLVRPSGETYKGLSSVSLDLIVGSEGRYRDFNSHFLPRHDHMKSRWARVDLAYYTDTNLPPIRLYEIGGVYFVRDGNHRVSVAKMMGKSHIDAEITVLDADIKLKKGINMSSLRKEVVQFEKRSFYIEYKFLELTGDDDLNFTTTGRYDEIREHILVHRYYLGEQAKKAISMDEATRSWYSTIYKPIIDIIDKLDILSQFRERTASDLYIFMVKYWDSLKKKYGESFSITDAILDYSQKHGERSTFLQKITKGIAKIFKK